MLLFGDNGPIRVHKLSYLDDQLEVLRETGSDKVIGIFMAIITIRGLVGVPNSKHSQSANAEFVTEFMWDIYRYKTTLTNAIQLKFDRYDEIN